MPLETISIAISVIALVLSIYTFKKTSKFQSHADVDTLYMNTLSMALNHPEFRDVEMTSKYKETFKDRNQLLAYETYAFIVWNLCETIFDMKKDDKTWYPVIESERRLHNAWFSNPENHYRFKKQFREFMENKFEQALTRLQEK